MTKPCRGCDRPNPRRCHLCQGRFYDATWTCHKCGVQLTLLQRAQRWSAFWFHNQFESDGRLVLYHRQLQAAGLNEVEAARIWLRDLPVGADWLEAEFPELM